MPTPYTSPEAFTMLVREHQQSVFRTLTRLTGPGPHVEDLAQEAFLRLYRALPEFRGDAAISTYLYRILVNLAQDEWKRRRRERTVLGSAPLDDEDPDDNGSQWLENQPGDHFAEHARTPEQQLAASDLQRITEEELNLLSPTERAVLVLYHQEEQTYEAISTALALPINTIRTHLHRGRRRLSDRIRARLGVPIPAEPGTAIPAAIATEGRA